MGHHSGRHPLPKQHCMRSCMIQFKCCSCCCCFGVFRRSPYHQGKAFKLLTAPWAHVLTACVWLQNLHRQLPEFQLQRSATAILHFYPLAGFKASFHGICSVPTTDTKTSLGSKSSYKLNICLFLKPSRIGYQPRIVQAPKACFYHAPCRNSSRGVSQPIWRAFNLLLTHIGRMSLQAPSAWHFLVRFL